MKNLNRLLLLLLLTPVLFAFYGCKEDIVYGDWIRVSDFSGVARSDASSFVIGKKGYVFGGYDGDDRLKDLWEYDTELDTWTQLAPLPDTDEGLGIVGGAARNSASAFAIGNKGYIGLGYDGKNYLKDFWEIDVTTNTWTKRDDFPGSARNGAIGFAVLGKGYFGGGFDDNYQKDLYVFDPTTNLWASAGDIRGSKRYNGGAFVYKDEVYIVGGMNNQALVTDFYKFNPALPEAVAWTELNRIADVTDNDWDDDYATIARQYPCIFIIDDWAYMTCGSTKSSLVNETWGYDFDADKWNDFPAFEGTSRSAAVAFSVDNRGFVLTGRSSSYRFDDVWEFLPDQEYDTQTY